MTIPIRSLLALAVAAATLASCDREKPAPAPTPAATPAVVTPADAAAPFTFQDTTSFAKVSLSLPQAVRGQTDLHARLYAAAVRDLRQFVEGAQADRTEAGAEADAPGYEKVITFDDAVETGKLFSLSRADYDVTGGAHGNTLYAAVMWDKATKKTLSPGDLFRKGADLSALDTALCAAVNAARKERDPTAVAISFKSVGWTCPRAAATPFVLAAGTTPGKAGGITYLIGPYQVGPYAEGAYAIDLPQAVVRPLIDAPYADEFAGEPVKRPAV